jgi:D-tyrosyl-tRNA(Tyr) deacylase
MIGLLQRVSNASVVIDRETVGSIGVGVLLMVAVERRDSEASAERLLERVLGYRVFPDAQGKMNFSLRDIGGGLLLVPQFTLAADTAKGTRASFSSAATPQDSERLFAFLVERARASHAPVAAGRFGANMQVSLVNDGPVTFWLRSGEGRD